MNLSIKEKIEEKIRQELRNKCVNVLNQAARNSPVDTGLLRNNWYAVTQNKIPTSSGSSGSMDLSNWKIGDDIVFCNPVKYARYQEYGTRYIRAKLMLTNAIKRVFGI